MRAAWDGHDVRYITTLPGLAEQFGAAPAGVIPDCNARAPVSAVRCLFALLRLTFRHRPGHVVTTGALSGLFAVVCGRAVGARTLWIDSIANGERLSSSGRVARRFAHETLSQWRPVAEAEGVGFQGSVL